MCSCSCEEHDITLHDAAHHLDIHGSCKIHFGDHERFLGGYPVSGVGALIIDHGGFHYLARETFVQQPFNGLESGQYPILL
jgi:hypothetical protein